MYNQPNKNIIILTDNIFTKFTVHKPPVQSFGTKKNTFTLTLLKLNFHNFKRTFEHFLLTLFLSTDNNMWV